MRLNIMFFFVLFLSLTAVFSPDIADSRYQSNQTTSSITGVVTDPGGALVPGATVTATNKQTGRSVSTTTDAEGRFSIKDLPPGIYRVAVEFSGFQTFTVDDVRVSVGLSTSLNIPLGDPVTDSIVGKIKGTVKSRSGQVIQGADVTITQLSNGKVYPVIKTDSEGKYEKPGLVPDRYKVRAAASGFRSSDKTVRLRQRDVKQVDFSLRPQ